MNLHETALPGREVIDLDLQGQAAASGYWCIEDVDPKSITRIHQEGRRIRCDGGEVGALWARRTGRHAIGLDEREVGGLDAIEVAEVELTGTFEVVDMQRGAPVAVVAAEVVGERSEAGRIELDFEEGAAATVDVEGGRVLRRVRIAVRLTGGLRIRERIAKGHAEPRCRRQLEPVGQVATWGCDRRRGSRIHRQLLRPGDIVCRAGHSREEADAGLVVADVMAVVIEARRFAVVECPRIGADHVAFDRFLDR